MGLLSSAAAKKKTDSADGRAKNFGQWAEQCGFKHCGVFCPHGSLMLLKYAYGIDSKSVFSSISTRDFWLGSLTSETFISIDRESPNFSAFTQFLGSEARNAVVSFKIRKISGGESGDFLVFFSYYFKNDMDARIQDGFSDELLEVLKNHSENLKETPTAEKLSGLTGSKKCRLCLVSLKRALGEAMDRIEVSELTIQRILLNTIFEELFYRTKKLFVWPDFIYSENSEEIKIAAIITSELEDEILKEQLFVQYKDIIGITAAYKTVILTAGYSSSGDEILDYLLRG